MLIRPVTTADLRSIVHLAEQAAPGMTTLPVHPDALADMIELSEKSYSGHVDKQRARYVVVLEDTVAGAVIGIASVIAFAGAGDGFYSYKSNRLVHRSTVLGRHREFELLTLTNDYTGATEVGTLYLLPSARQDGIGRWLARSRYMLIGQHPERFAPRIMAEMRGWQRPDGSSPFWDAVGARFFEMPFVDADRMSAVLGNHFIAELLPKHPIYVELLAPEARTAIGRPHESSARAMKMLGDEGFSFEQYVDVFDAGPAVHAQTERIETIASALSADVSAHDELSASATEWLISTTSLTSFCCVRGSASLAGDRVRLPTDLKRMLGVVAGDTVRLAPPVKSSSNKWRSKTILPEYPSFF